MRKLFLILMCVSTLLLITSCPSPAADDTGDKSGDITAPVTLNILAYADGEAETFRSLCNEFEKANPKVKIQFEYRYDEEYHQRVTERLASGDIPDIAYMGVDARWGGKWKAAGQWVDNTPYIPGNVDTRFVPVSNGIKPYVPDGGPNFCSVVAVNMQLLEQIGGKLPKTYEDFKELAELCKANDIKCLTTQGADAWVWGSCIMSGIIPRTTNNPFWIEDAVKGKVKFTDSNFVAALDVLRQWVADGILDKDSVNDDLLTARNRFLDGEYLMFANGQWDFGENNYGELSGHIKLIPIPAVPGQTGYADAVAGAYQVGYGLTKKCVESSDPNVVKAAAKWLAFYHSYQNTVKRLNDGAISTPIISNFTVPADIDPFVLQKINLLTKPVCWVIDSYLSGAANDALNEGMMNIVKGEKTAEQVASEVQAAFDAQ